MSDEVVKETQIFTPEDKRKLIVKPRQAYKFLYPSAESLLSSMPVVTVRNFDNSHILRVPLTQALKELFYGSDHFYVDAVIQGDGRMHIFAFIGNQGWPE